LLKTVQAINSGQYRAISQELISIEGSELKPAPKIFKEDCLIRWDKTSGEINNLIRGLSPYPGAVATIKTTGGDAVSLKIFKAEKEIFAQPTELPGKILTDHRSFMKVCCKDGYLKIAELQQEGKRRMSIEEFLRGFRLESDLMQW
jgi:methionyl-tRNA formyltransferase